MEYTPRYTQPFTLSEVIALDVSTITEEEIARLQNSLKHLGETQQFLREAMEVEDSDNVDAELTKAYEENQVVIGSQEERISMLKMALTEKGVVSGAHYDDADKAPESAKRIAQAEPGDSHAEVDDESSEGIHL
ncbi:hypothetical protein D9758_008850 [Tetrapyrgos nigripes]|uniref:Uncharacterized protein n=1 Tax=Tetrapyrgos nigripes TaxID=182062 RepID=A0A8H5CNF8_9AGAR|nr:hypothetical protein D9758_008850 [Tetrapyrgos nigripes]